MSLLTNILYPITEPIADFYTKLKASITTINLLGGGSADEVLTKTGAGDFEFAWSAPTASLTTPLPPINTGAWNMTTTASISIAHGVADFTKIKKWSILIQNDAGTKRYDFLNSSAVIGSDNAGRSGYLNEINATHFIITRISAIHGGIFYGTDFDDGVINRGELNIEVSA